MTRSRTDNTWTMTQAALLQKIDKGRRVALAGRLVGPPKLPNSCCRDRTPRQPTYPDTSWPARTVAPALRYDARWQAGHGFSLAPSAAATAPRALLADTVGGLLLPLQWCGRRKLRPRLQQQRLSKRPRRSQAQPPQVSGSYVRVCAARARARLHAHAAQQFGCHDRFTLSIPVHDSCPLVAPYPHSSHAPCSHAAHNADSPNVLEPYRTWMLRMPFFCWHACACMHGICLMPRLPHLVPSAPVTTWHRANRRA